MPIGTPMNVAIAVITSVPTMALTSPPPWAPGGGGSFVKKLQFRAIAPRAITVQRIHVSSTSASMANRPERTLMTRSAALRLVWDRGVIVPPPCPG